MSSQQRSKIVLIGAPPGTGKSTIVPPLRHILHNAKISSQPWIFLDNEWSFSIQMRKLCSDKSGISLDSPDFVRAFNLRGQLDYQSLARNLAAQGVNVIMPGPFEDLTPEVDGMPLYKKMKEKDFGDFDFKAIYVLVHPEKRLSSAEVGGHPSMVEVEEVIRERLLLRGKGNPVQASLDADKFGENYYSLRSQKVLRTVEMFPEIPLVTYPPSPKCSPWDVAYNIFKSTDIWY
ncbi:MAG TPA: hypothetical protein PKA63_03615 [Oligoflexia bacterium]|nr:hypothetical protein [Oligoflexia bacterium]HMP47742.1 hypothetical protein [Oligoflexia bacterium]